MNSKETNILSIQAKTYLIKIVVFFILTGVVFSCKKDDTEIIDNRTPKELLTHKLDSINLIGAINGFGVSIVSQNGTLYQKGFGYADVESKTEYTTTTLQPIASVSKTFLGLALLKAQEEGKLNIDDSINKYLPFKVYNPYYPDIPITIRHLASHTSTLDDTEYYDARSYILRDNINYDKELLKEYGIIFNDPSQEISMPAFLENIFSKKGDWYDQENFLNAEPGKIFNYSNTGAGLAGYIIELATGVPYKNYIAKNILEPLHMSSTGLFFEDIDEENLSTLYFGYDFILPRYSCITYPDGSIITSIADMSLYLIELIKGYSKEGVVLKDESYSELYKPYFDHGSGSSDIYDDEYNNGIFMGITPISYFGHTGSDPGIAVFMFFNPVTKIGKILMINRSLTSNKSYHQFMSIWETLAEYENKIN